MPKKRSQRRNRAARRIEPSPTRDSVEVVLTRHGCDTLQQLDAAFVECKARLAKAENLVISLLEEQIAHYKQSIENEKQTREVLNGVADIIAEVKEHRAAKEREHPANSANGLIRYCNEHPDEELKAPLIERILGCHKSVIQNWQGRKAKRQLVVRNNPTRRDAKVFRCGDLPPFIREWMSSDTFLRKVQVYEDPVSVLRRPKPTEA